MGDNVGTLPNKGSTLLSGSNRTLSTTAGKNAGIEGTVKVFKDAPKASGGGAASMRSGREKVCILVRNASGIALLPKRAAKWAAGQRGKQVGGYVTETAEECAGIVDEDLPAAGVPDDDYFWLEVRGPCLCKMPLSAIRSTVENDVLYAVTAATSQATTAGRLQSWAGTFTVTETTNGAATKVPMNKVGRALSAVTSQATGDADILVDLELK